MANFIFVTPLKDALVKHPDSYQPIPKEGRRVRSDAYWLRMKEQGLVEISEDKAQKTSSAKEPSK